MVNYSPDSPHCKRKSKHLPVQGCKAVNECRRNELGLKRIAQNPKVRNPEEIEMETVQNFE